MLDVGVRRVSQHPPRPKEKVVSCHCLTLCALQHSQRAQTNTNKRKQAQDPFPGGVGGTQQTTSMTTNDPIFHTKLLSSSKGSTIRSEKSQKESTDIHSTKNKPRLEHRTSPRTCSPSHHDSNTQTAKKTAVGPRMTSKTGFVSSKGSKTRQAKRQTRRN